MAELMTTLLAGRAYTAPTGAVAAFVDRAHRADLVDVAYTTYDAPFGTLVLAATDVGLVRLAFDPVPEVITDLSRRISPRVLLSPARLDAVRTELDQYFAGVLSRFDVAIDLRLVGSPFRRSVLAAADAIPYGEVRSYTSVAQATGSPAATRAVGSALGANPVCIVVPCHRVVRSDGSVSGYAGGATRKHFLLDLERAG